MWELEVYVVLKLLQIYLVPIAKAECLFNGIAICEKSMFYLFICIHILLTSNYLDVYYTTKHKKQMQREVLPSIA